MLPEPRRALLGLQTVVHGGLDRGELLRLGINPDAVVDFSANINPYGPSPTVRAALMNTPLETYPDRDSLALRDALAEMLAVPAQEILVGNGASELIWLAAMAFVRPGDRVLVIGPTFGEYARAAQFLGALVTPWQAQADDEFTPQISEITRVLGKVRPRVVFACNPNNPTGAVLPPDVFASWARQYPETLFIVDEAYQAFAAGNGSALDFQAENVMVLGSMTKDFGLAGLRLGYAVGPAPLVEPLRRLQPPWSVNALAQAAGVAALQDLPHRENTLKLLGQAKEVLVAGLTRLGLPPVPSVVGFFLINVGDGAAFRLALLRRGILVRDCASFGLPEYVRIATRRPEENERLLAAVREVR